MTIRERPLKIIFFIAYLFIVFGLFFTNLELGLKVMLNGVTILVLVILYIILLSRYKK